MNAKIIDRLSAPSDTMTMESNAILRKAASNFDALHQQLNQVFENQLTCQSKVAELQRDFMKAEQDISVQREREAALRSKRLREGADVRGCPNDLITALFIIISKHEERGWTDRHARESMYINAPDYLATCTKIEKFIKGMQDPMTESIRLKVKIPFTVCLRISKVLQRRDNAFVDLATRYNNMDPRELGIESDSLSHLHRMLGEIAAISRQSGISALSGNVSASAAHVSSGMTEFTAAAVKVSGPHWAGRKNTQTRDKTGSDTEGKYECAAEG